MLKDVATIIKAQTEWEKEYWGETEKDGQISHKFCTGTDQEDQCVGTEEQQGLVCSPVAKPESNKILIATASYKLVQYEVSGFRC